MTRAYGAEPKDLEFLDLTPREFCYVQDMPIALPDGDLCIPKPLEWVLPLVRLSDQDMADCFSLELLADSYTYLTVKHLPVRAGSYITRPGWHADSFGSDDITYIWSNVVPTEFAIQPFNLSQDCDLSLVQMEEQATNITTYENKHLLRLDQFCIHRPGPIRRDCVRTFIKVTYSDKIFALEGNARNPLIKTDWEYQPRRKERNHPWGEEK